MRDLISVEAAFSKVMSVVLTMPVVDIPLTDAIGKPLAEDILADRDFPPFDRVTMDGIAISCNAWRRGARKFKIQGMAAAGSPQMYLSSQDAAIEIMTGAVMPEGADAIVPYEQVTIRDGFAFLGDVALVAGQNVHKKGQDSLKGKVLVKQGDTLGPMEVGICASVGKSHVKVKQPPKVAMVSTGDELVPITSKPLDYQIRQSNHVQLGALLKPLGVELHFYHVMDDTTVIRQALATLLEKFDIVLLSGGISKGKYDFLPDVLGELGVYNHFHGVTQRPGKPFWFGATFDGKPVFAFPGNPVSTLHCATRYLIPWLKKSLGWSKFSPIVATLTETVHFKPNLTFFQTVHLQQSANGEFLATPVKISTSGDMVSPSKAHGFAELALEKSVFGAGERVTVWPFHPYFFE